MNSFKLITRYVLATVLFTNWTGCSSKSIDQNNAGYDYEKTLNDANILYSFAFSYQGSDYYFLNNRTQGFQNDCNRFDGFKNGQLTYSFEENKIHELTKIYNQNSSIEQKINHSINYIDNILPRLFRCQENSNLKKSKSFLKQVDETLGYTLGFVIYGSMAVIVLPIALPIIAADEFAENRILNKLKKIRLQQSFDEVTKTMSSDYSITQEDKFIIQTFSATKSSITQSARRFVFVYRNDRLIAYVWGEQPVADSNLNKIDKKPQENKK